VTQVRLLGSYAFRVTPRATDQVPVLMRSVNGEPEEEMVEGVEYLRFLYGIDFDADRVPDEFRSTLALGAGETIVSIKIGLVLRSVSNESDVANAGGQLGVVANGGQMTVLEPPRLW